MAAAAIPYILAAATVASAVSSIQQGRAAEAASKYNAATNLRNAGIARSQAAADADAQRRRAYQIMGAARANYGASGITQEGSPLDVLEMSAGNAELDRQNILYKGELRAMGYSDTAQLDYFRGENAMDTAYGKAGSELLMGAGKTYDAIPKVSKTTASFGSSDGWGDGYGT